MIVPKKSVFTRLFGVFCFGMPWGRCLAPKPGALPTALHPEKFIFCFILRYYIILYTKSQYLSLAKSILSNKDVCRLTVTVRQQTLLAFFLLFSEGVLDRHCDLFFIAGEYLVDLFLVTFRGNKAYKRNYYKTEQHCNDTGVKRVLKYKTEYTG